MGQLASASPPPDSFGALLRAGRHRACLSQEQLAARTEVSERTVRNLEADRVRLPRTDTVRLLADALRLSEREREHWFEAARGVSHQRAALAAPAAGGPVCPPNDASAQPPPILWDFSMVNNHLCPRSSTGMDKAETVELGRRAAGPAGPAAKDVDVPEAPAPAWAGQAGGMPGPGVTAG
jgi:transcriptional regulator with XRE-family HTH domain